MKIWEKVSNIMKIEFNSKLIYNKKYLKAEKIINAKQGLQYFYIPIILSN